jgi:hypothetical protein
MCWFIKADIHPPFSCSLQLQNLEVTNPAHVPLDLSWLFPDLFPLNVDSVSKADGKQRQQQPCCLTKPRVTAPV